MVGIIAASSAQMVGGEELSKIGKVACIVVGGFLFAAGPASAICLSPMSYSGDAFKKISNAIEYTVCLIGDQATVINQHADIIEGIKTDISTLQMDMMDIEAPSESSAFGELTVSNAKKINDLNEKMDAILSRLDALESR